MDNKPLSPLVERSHYWVQQIRHKNKAVDATCGNGHDTVFLATLFTHVYAFDIQEKAILRTKQKTAHLSNVTLIHDSFVNLTSYLTEPIDLFIYNLGFLPGTDAKIKTDVTTTVPSLLMAYSLLRPNGLILVACYLRHPGGREEYDGIIDALNKNYISYVIEHPSEFDVLIRIVGAVNDAKPQP